MAVPSVLTDLSATAASNSPSGSETIGSSLDDYLRGIQAAIRGGLAHKGADIASATSTDIGAVAGLMHDITGTTTITGLGTVSAGIWKILQFDGALTLTHNATSLVLPGGANITTAAGDVATVISEGAGNWRCVSYFRAVTVPLQAASDTAAGVIEYAVQSEMESGASNVLAVTPGRQHFHPGHPKCWAMVTVAGGTPTLQTSYNITSITDTNVGKLTITIATDFSSANWCCQCSVVGAADVGTETVYVANISSAPAAGSVLLECVLVTGATNDYADPVQWHMFGLGDQA